MEDEEFIENYTEELQLLDALDKLSEFSTAAAETVDLLVSCSNNEKIASSPHLSHPKKKSYVLNTR